MSRAVHEESWVGGYRDYDLVKEFVAALVAVTLLTVGLAFVFGSPDVHQITLAQWSNASPSDFLATAATELDRTSGSATYGAPYTHDPSAAQKLGPITPQNWPGVTKPVDTVNDFVVMPLRAVPGDTQLTQALGTWDATSPGQRDSWAKGYDSALQTASGDPAKVASGSYGPVPVLLGQLLRLAQSGGLDGALLEQGRFYMTDYTKPLLFLADGTYLEDKAVAQHLGGDQSGMMNETGSYPGQEWLWLYTFWYQIKPFSSEANSWGANADAVIWGIMAILSLGLVLLPYVPGVRSVPRWIPVHRLVWKRWYAEHPRT